ncbi:prolipoprotein diacylglyceryl transferase [Sinomicrobium weinanense]|uniref:Phosphatidylglycerol--prolipoprotein diacylglyceryl transferase n=1 Tax=Sinomicrobium weinanense TaxID=2842200 RepID=A0A926Q4N6_9FLAO|nr:prolipoprotein diacylglyceryl transferase [Sinomicrobium weinanense]MBC9798174.1 prolipoprotein diacylglyceryl transferase [Sinomicrobium weinanense]MBU3122138.1 prolipoprotein diacylglyceryl transferase [Sinomicrobium weinanense]
MEDGILHWNMDPVIFRITDTFPLKYYGLLFVTGLLLGYAVVRKIYQRENIPVADLDKLLTYIVIGTVVGARLGHCLFYEPLYYLQHPLEIFLPIQKIDGAYTFTGYQGLASHGGGIGVFIAILLYCKKYKSRPLRILDLVAMAIPLTGTFIRLGNFMNSEIYGKPTDGNWGVVFVRDDLIPRHPTQLYEALSYLLIFFILKALYRNTEKQEGYLFGLFLILLFSARFTIEFFKENQVQFENQIPLNMGQILSIPFILIGMALVFRPLSSARGPGVKNFK